MSITRREALHGGLVLGATLGMPGYLYSHASNNSAGVGRYLDSDNSFIHDPIVRQSLLAAVDAAVKKGASYADTRITHTRIRRASVKRYSQHGLESSSLQDAEEISIGVRALVNGVWGFSSGPVLGKVEGSRLGAEAVTQAKSSLAGRVQKTEMTSSIKPAAGTWEMPVEVDPFMMHPKEILDIMSGQARYAVNLPECVQASVLGVFHKQEKAFASSEGAYTVQTLFRSSGELTILYAKDDQSAKISIKGLDPKGAGFEVFEETRIRGLINEAIVELAQLIKLPVKPVDVGRYEAIIDSPGAASIVRRTFGVASELDRALGTEANAGGTSYLSDPIAMLGSEKVASSLITVSCDRSEKWGLATVRWDDEGVTPVRTPIVTEGVLTNFQTSREFAGWLGGAQRKNNYPSSGCAYSPKGVDAPLIHPGNLTLHWGSEDVSLDDMLSDLDSGILIKGLSADMDFQQLNGVGYGAVFEVKKGKIAARVANAAIMFRAPEFWKEVTRVGGKSSAIDLGGATSKGEPAQQAFQTVYAVPIHNKSVSLIDPLRKA